VKRSALPDLTIDDAIVDFARDLRLDRAPRTIETYCEASRLFARFADAEGIEMLSEITTPAIRAWLTSLRDTGRSEATLFNRYSGLRALLVWAVGEGLLANNPMDAIPRPEPVAPLVPVLRPEQLAAMLKACEGTSFDDIRDLAVLRLLLDTGMRRAELVGLKIGDVDLDQDVALVMGKGSRPRACPFGVRTAKALRRYLRVRTTHTHADRAELWLGKRGALHPEAIRGIVRRRATQAGLEGRVFVHQLRHTWAHEALQRMNESDVQRLGGWRDREMLSRYGASGADERARRAYREHSLGDRL
jgi:site-specific recombinase XerD